MRSWLALGLLTLSVGASSQQLAPAISAAFELIKQKSTGKKPPSSNPLEAAGFPVPTGQRPLPSSKLQDQPVDPKTILVRSADQFSRDGDRIIASGNVRFSYQGYDVTADRVDGNVQTQIFLLSGHALVVGSEQVVRGDEVLVNFKDRTFRYLDGSAQLGPTQSKGNLIGDLFVHGQTGSGNETIQEFGDCTFTTCNEDPPHFSIHARRATVHQNEQAVLRDVKVNVLGRNILTIPYLVVPLHKYSDRYTPEVGQSRDEGYYVKTNIFTPLRGSGYITNHVDYYTKLGFGLGQDYHYFGKELQGIFRYYGLTGHTKTFLTNLNHRQNMFGGQLTIDSTYQKDNYLTSPGTTQSNMRAQFLLPQNQNSTRFSYFRSSNRSSSFEFRQENYGISDQRFWDPSFSTQTDLNLVSTTSSRTQTSLERRSEFDLALRATKEFAKFSAEFEYLRNIPIESPDQFFSGADHTPFITLRSSAAKLMGPKFGNAWPMKFLFSFGELQESQEVGRIRRTYLDMDVAKPWNLDKRQTVTFSSRFRQGIYSDDTAGYVLNFNVDYRYGIGQDGAFNFRYAYLRPYGFTPLQLDQTGKLHLFTADLSFKPIRSLLFSAQTGFDVLQLDLRQTPWQTVGLTSTWTPNNKFQLRGYTNYDTFAHNWSNVRLDAGWYTSQGLLSIGTRYDGQRHTWGALNIFADGIVWKKLRTSAILAYNGYTKRFDSKQLSFTYDLHCAELIFQVVDNPVGFRSGTQYGLYLRIKALPFSTPFGVGTRGQAVGGGLGF